MAAPHPWTVCFNETTLKNIPMRKFFLISNVNLPQHNLRPFLLILSIPFISLSWNIVKKVPEKYKLYLNKIFIKINGRVPAKLLFSYHNSLLEKYSVERVVISTSFQALCEMRYSHLHSSPTSPKDFFWQQPALYSSSLHSWKPCIQSARGVFFLAQREFVLHLGYRLYILLKCEVQKLFYYFKVP